MIKLNSRALLPLLLATSIPLLNACKELEEQNSTNEQTDEFVQPEEQDTGTQQPTFAPIQINAAPGDLSGYAGQTATFAVTASSELSLTYQWYHDGAQIEGANAPTLSFVIAGLEDSGTYRVAINNSTTSVEAAAELLVGNIPNISGEPQDVSIYPGQDAVFTVQATGDDVEYEWQRRTLFGWATLEAETSDTLVVEDVSTSTTKQYRVKVKNGGGSKTSRNTRINLKNPISISSQPTDQLVAEGGYAVFSVVATGYGTLNYRWYKNGAALSNGSKYSGATSSALSVTNVSLADSGLYHVVITNDDGRSMNSDTAQLSVQGPAVVTTHPSSTTLYAGQSGQLAISASGDAPISYQWQKWNGSSWQNVSGATGSRLSIGSASSSDAGRYRCVVGNNVASDTSREATVTVLQAVSISQSPASQTVAEGESVTFTVAAAGDDLQYEWTKNGQVIADSGASLSFAAVRELDEGTYSCRVYNAGGSANCASFTLSIQSPAAIVTQPVSQATYEGGSVSLSVAVTGDPAPSVEWRFNGDVVGTGTTLALNYITPEQAGDYLCVVSNALATVNCAVATVSVSSSVRITEQPANTAINEGENLSLTVAASGEDLQYEWIKDGQNLSLNSATLSLTDVSPSDAGTYSCRVWNEHSSATCSPFTLSINGRVAITSQPSGATVYETTPVTLTVGHTGDANAQVSWYHNDTLVATNSGTLTLNSITLAQAGEYRCVVANDVNSEACNPVTVAVLENARITKQLSSQMLSAGDTLQLDIEASGEGPLLYECFHNGSQIFSTTNPSALNISDVSSAHEGNYYCTVSNEGATVTSDTVAITVVGIQTRNILVTWDAPDTRSDGTLLDPLEISGYSLHICPEGETSFQTILTTSGTSTEAVIELTPGVYTLTITTLDVNGLESGMSTEYQFTIQ